jgi:hypothetical protein
MNEKIIMIILAAGVIMFLGSFISLSYYVGGKDDYAALRPMLTTISVVNMVAVVLFMIGILTFFARYPANGHLFSVGLSGLAIFLSFTAVSVSVLGKVYS